jgi:SagB-type dehydrogenase family enzyme
MSDPLTEAALAPVRAYHQATKHHLHGYAPSPGFLDWESQPDPFRRFAGAPLVPLPLEDGADRCAYDALYDAAAPVEGAPTDRSGLGLVLELALGLSAWKGLGPDRWALRNAPSSGNLHPTEGYLLLWRTAAPELVPGLYHYAPHEHALERRATLPAAVAAALAEACPGAFGALGLSSVIWREEWKYGARAYRYCQLDIGHALGAARMAARVLGWRLTVDLRPGDAAVAACLGLDRDEDFAGAEAEHPDLLALIGPAAETPAAVDWSAVAGALTAWNGRANRLSKERVRWPEITAVLPAVEKPEVRSPPAPLPALPPDGLAAGPPDLAGLGPKVAAATLLRRRRSAQRMDGRTPLPAAAFRRLLERTLPRPGRPPFDVLPWPPALNLLLFVHAVDDLKPGLYLLIRDAARLAAFHDACTAPDLAWEPMAETALPLYRLRTPADLRRTASQLSCHQGIAGRGALSLGMVGALGPVLAAEGPWAYRRLHWEAGLIGQVLYLEAEAAGLRGTGIGCFLDDEVHRLLGLATDGGAPWQSLYHFTLGGAIDDPRLTTTPAYAHLADRTPP